MTAYYNQKSGEVAEGVELPPAPSWIDASSFSPSFGSGTKADQGYVFGSSWGFQEGLTFKHATTSLHAGAEEKTDWFYPWEMANQDGTHKYGPTDAVVATAADAYRSYWTGRAITDWRTGYNFRLAQAKLEYAQLLTEPVLAAWSKLSSSWGSEVAMKTFLEAGKDVPHGTTWIVFKWVYDRAEPVFPTGYGSPLPDPTPVFKAPAVYMASEVLIVTGQDTTGGSNQAPSPSQLQPPPPAPTNNNSAVLVLLGLAALLLMGKKHEV